MNSSTVEAREALAVRVTVTEDTLSVELSDGRTIAAPVAWYPRLAQATVEERANWRLIGGGIGIHWPAVDEDVSVANMLNGQPSAESQSSFERWLAGRQNTGRLSREADMSLWERVRQLEGRRLHTVTKGNPFKVDAVHEEYLVVWPDGGIPRLIMRRSIEQASDLAQDGEKLTLARLRAHLAKGHRNLSYVLAVMRELGR